MPYVAASSVAGWALATTRYGLASIISSIGFRAIRLRRYTGSVMQFINPKIDFAFKKIFGSAQSKPILISFLNALLYQEQPVIEDLEIIDPYLAPKILGMKDTYVDVRARLRNGDLVIIEMQVLNVAGLEKRILYNAAKAYSGQLLVGESYQQLHAIIALTITDFVMFPDQPDVQSAYVLKEKSLLTDYPEGDLELVFVELPKFTKTLEELQGIKEKWLYFIKQAPALQLVPPAMSEVPEIGQAFTIANQANLSREELELQERKWIYIQDQKGVFIKGEEIGLEKGLAKGLEQGLEQGLEKGREEKAREIARNLLSRMTNEEIAACTGLTLAEVSALRVQP
jgi:predicted transposase/invertase (TIGR01784 family)